MSELPKKPIALFGGYFDESGITPDLDVCVIAGFIGGPPAMNGFVRDWNRVLDKYGVRGPFHSVQFYAPAREVAKSTSNPYRGWSNTKRKKYIANLLGAIEKRNLPLHSTGVDAVAFRQKSEAERRWLTGGLLNAMNLKKWRLSGSPNAPYFYVFRSVIEGCAARVPEGQQIHLTMSEQNQYQGFAGQLYRAILDRKPPFDFADRLDDSITFGSHKKFPQLQAADLASYHTYQFCLRRRLDQTAVPEGIELRVARRMLTTTDLQTRTPSSGRAHNSITR